MKSLKKNRTIFYWLMEIIWSSRFSVHRWRLYGNADTAFFYVTFHGCFPSPTAQLSNCNRDRVMHKVKTLLSGSLQKESTSPGLITERMSGPRVHTHPYPGLHRGTRAHSPALCFSDRPFPRKVLPCFWDSCCQLLSYTFFYLQCTENK